MSEFQTLLIDQLVESPTNPRRTFDPVTLAELTESIKTHGVMQPILVRPGRVQREGLGVDEAYEIVAGHRRVRAARLAQIQAVPAIVRALSDREVLEIQLVENLQRDDLSPLDEAEGYRALADRHELSVEAIAGKIGKSREYVFARMKLLALGDEGRQALAEGTITPSVALLVARLPKVLQPAAIKDVGPRPWRDNQPMSAREAAETIRRQYTRPLKGAPFDPKAQYFQAYPAQLTPVAPPCAQCEKRTKCAEDLFNADPKAPDMCMDGTCYDAKRQAEDREVVRRAKAAGLRVIEGDEVTKLAKKHNLSRLPGYVRADESTCEFSDRYTEVKKLIKAAGEHAPQPELLVVPGREATDDHRGYDAEVVKLYKTTALRAALEKAGWFARHATKSGSAGGASKPRKEDPKAKAAREAAELQAAIRMAILRALRPKMQAAIAECGGLPFVDTVREIARGVIEDAMWQDAGNVMSALYSEDSPDRIRLTRGWPNANLAVFDEAPMLDLFEVMWVAQLAELVEDAPHDRSKDRLLLEADRLGVDCVAIEARVKLLRRERAFLAENLVPEEETPADAAPKKAAKPRGKRLKDLDQAELEAAATGGDGELVLEDEA